MQFQFLRKVTVALCALVVVTTTFAQSVEAQPLRVHASWYGGTFHNKQMANGKRFNMRDPTIAAHKTIPIGTIIRVRNVDNDKVLYMVVQDRGPFIEGRDLDLSQAAAEKLGILEKGVGVVELEVLQRPE